ncbi:MAG: trehalase family glycosidase [bacterium]
MKMLKNHNLLFILSSVLLFSCNEFQWSGPSKVPIKVQQNFSQLLNEEDTDNDLKITVDDTLQGNNSRGDGVFYLKTLKGDSIKVETVYYLSNLLQELYSARKVQEDTLQLDLTRVYENPVDRISRLIRERYWNNLTRKIDLESLPEVLPDQKMAEGETHYLYVPVSDSFASQYFHTAEKLYEDIDLQVESLPEKITPVYVKNLEGKHGLLSLGLYETEEGRIEGIPYVVPGGRFNEMYGWDSYFIILGLLEDGKKERARSLVDNFVYEIIHYKKILNANRTYYLTRSQPPFLTSMAKAVYKHMEKNQASRQWLKKVIKAAVYEYENVWMNPHHLTETGLSRYAGTGKGPAPEVEPGHYDYIYRKYAQKRGMPLESFKEKYNKGIIEVPELDQFFKHDRAMRESGHDTSYRWNVNGEDRCADFATVDLNSLLYKYEIDIVELIEKEFQGSIQWNDTDREEAETWRDRSEKRKILIRHYLWNQESGIFFDYDTRLDRQHRYESATCLYPLWACHTDNPDTYLLSKKEAETLVKKLCKVLEAPGGLAGSSPASRGELSPQRPARQWDWPYGWAPHQMLAWRGLKNFKLNRDVLRLVYKWLYTITRNAADYNGTIPEKFNVVTRSHKVFAEYGNVGTEFSYITREGFGWMNASYQVGLRYLPESYLQKLKKLIPPETIFPESEKE